MFYKSNMNQEQKTVEQPQQPQKPHHLSQHENSDSDIDEKDIEKACRIMEKLKKIQKRGQLSKIKQKSKKTNQLFHQMSTFFHRKKDHIQQAKKIKNKALREARQARFKSAVNLFPPRFMENINDQPEISEGLNVQRKTVNHELKCHICSKEYQQIHHFYGHFCPPCAALNWTKRNQTANMKGLTALITGARIKIGFEISLKLLREGATVIATSRFCNDCLLRYQKQKDYELWKQNLFIIQCDFLSQTQVAALVNYIQQNVKKLDILINNAAQTLVRPKEFYTQQLKNQELRLEFPNKVESNALAVIKNNPLLLFPSVFSSQVTKPQEIDLTSLDEFGQPLDKRTTNSWSQKIEDVSLMDCYTTQVINSIVPFYLISQLKSKMIGPTPSWVINVSSMEGVFYRKNKQEFHPQTNMAKAALNMITRTSAQEFKDHNIFMNSVDTGWVTNENPYHIAKTMNDQHRFKCPLDCLDGAMRVLDPIYLGLLSQRYPFGQFLKNYESSYW